MGKLRHWLANIAITNPVEQQQARIFQYFLIGWSGIALPIWLLSLGLGDPPVATPSPAFQIGFAVLTAASALLWISPVSALVLLRHGAFQRSVIIAAGGLLLSQVIAMVLLGVTGSFLLVFIIPITFVGLLSTRGFLFAVTGVTLATVAVMSFLQSRTPPLVGFLGRALSAPVDGSPAGVASTGIDIPLLLFFFIVIMLLSLLLDRFGTILHVALATALQRESELEAIRSSLETTVADRTRSLQTALADVQAQAAEQARLLAEIAQQQSLITDLSVPVIPISATTLVMPLVGALDGARLQLVQEQSLQALARTRAHTLVLDITGVPIVDTHVAHGLLLTVRSARLLGATVVLVGIRPEVAQTLVGLGIDLPDVQIFSTLQSALAPTREPVKRET